MRKLHKQKVMETRADKIEPKRKTKNPGPKEAPNVEVAVEEREEIDTPWRVLLYNDEIHTFREVIIQLTKALNCTRSQAENMALKVHHEGKALVYEGDFEPCFEVNAILKEIQLITEIKG